MSNLHKETRKLFSAVIKELYDYGSHFRVRLPDDVLTCLLVNPKNGRAAGMISKEVYDIVMANKERLDSAIIYDRDFNYNLYVQ